MMNNSNNFLEIIEHARDVITDSRRLQLVIDGRQRERWETQQGAVRFELYHAAGSLCSHKVRLTLAELGISYLSAEVELTFKPGERPENYDPRYVWMRLQNKQSHRFVNSFTGQSSVESEGFDPAVVPTLVDREKQIVVVDSANICRYLCGETSKTELIPKNIESEISQQLSIVDQTPHVALLYGRHPGKDNRPEVFLKAMDVVHDHKVTALNHELEKLEPNSDLHNAYKAKVEKEQSAKSFVHDPKSMQECIDTTHGILERLNDRLATGGKTYLFSESPTLADLVWGVSLARLKMLELDSAERFPKVVRYGEALMARPAFQSAISTWPGAMLVKRSNREQ